MQTVYFEYDPEQAENSWQEVVLIDSKDSAIRNFAGNLPKLAAIWKQIESDPQVLQFIENVKRWKGENLVLDASEIVEDHEKAREDFSAALEFLENRQAVEFAKSLNDYSGNFEEPNFFAKLFSSRDRERVADSIGYFIGYTYR